MKASSKFQFIRLIRLFCFAAACLCLPFSAGDLEAKKKDKGKPGGGNSGGGNSGGGNSGGGNSGGGNSGGGNSGGGKPGGGNSGGGKIGDPMGNTVAKYHLKEWKVAGDYEIVGPTVMVIDEDFDIGNNTIDIASSGSLELYVGGDVTANGKGAINNNGTPSQLIIFGTHPEKKETESVDHTLTLSGNGALTGVVYAPNAEYRTNGGGNAGSTSGSVVAKEIRFNGSPGPFHFDEALKEIDLGLGGYTLGTYELMPNGETSASEESQAVFGSSDYATLFGKLFKAERD